MYLCERVCSPLQARAPAAVEADLSGDARAAAGELETRWEETVTSQEEVTHVYPNSMLRVAATVSAVCMFVY